MSSEQIKPTATTRAIEKINAIYDKLPISECLKVREETGKHLYDRITQEQDKIGEEIMNLGEMKNKISGTITK